MIPIIAFVGASGVGKTTLLEKIVANLKVLDYRVAVIKHAAHSFEIDKPGKDSWRFHKAGSDIVVLASRSRVATIHEVSREPTLAELAAAVEDKVDMILAEGFKDEDWPKIEVYRSAVSQRLFSEPGELLGIVSDHTFPIPVPRFGFEEIPAIVELILGHVSGAMDRKMVLVGTQ